jgi:cell wall-associated NlpC family hydrolase
MIRILFLLIVIVQLMSCGLPARYNKKQENSDRVVLSASVKSTDDELMTVITSWLGTPYKYGGNSINGIDCSGFTAIIMKQVYNIKIPRTARDQYNSGNRLHRNDLHAGDLVFFRDIRSRGIDHVGIYIGENRFVHATESSGVVISSLSEDYYYNRFSGARRYSVE